MTCGPALQTCICTELQSWLTWHARGRLDRHAYGHDADSGDLRDHAQHRCCWPHLLLHNRPSFHPWRWPLHACFDCTANTAASLTAEVPINAACAAGGTCSVREPLRTAAAGGRACRSCAAPAPHSQPAACAWRRCCGQGHHALHIRQASNRSAPSISFTPCWLGEQWQAGKEEFAKEIDGTAPGGATGILGSAAQAYQLHY